MILSWTLKELKNFLIMLGVFLLSIIMIIIDFNVIKNDEFNRHVIFNEYSEYFVTNSDKFFSYFFCIISTSIFFFACESFLEFTKKDSTMIKIILNLYENSIVFLYFNQNKYI